MQLQQVKTSANFKKVTTKAILSIALFMMVYLLLISLAVVLTAVLGYAGIMIIVAKPMIFTLMIGAGLISMGILILIFLFKFLFKKHVVDRTHLTEITIAEEPKLFRFIADIVESVNTKFPKKIYLSSEVNASVFYNSSFWSMFFPVRKNLEIGVGLINTVTKNEFKAIMAHEFGHFSQRSMKVGSYVYNVNKIIYNLLYENDSYDALAQKWASVSGYFVVFVRMAIAIIQGIKWVLKKIYDVVNLNYMGLSREMEFHADEVAASVAGSKPLIDSLLRMDLADNAYRSVLGFYNDRVADSTKTHNLYSQHGYVLNFLAKESELPMENSLPLVKLDQINRYNKSKLNIKDQWASHPSTEDRVRELNRLNVAVREDDHSMASTLFTDIESLQRKITDKLFSAVTYEKPTKDLNNQEFIDAFSEEFKKNSFGKLFNSYYDNRNPPGVKLENGLNGSQNLDNSTNELFSDKSVDLVYESIAMQNDIHILKQIEDGHYKIKSFDYDGTKYTRKDLWKLIPHLETALNSIKEDIRKNDESIYTYFFALAQHLKREEEFNLKYQGFINYEEEYKTKMEAYIAVVNISNLFHQTNTFEVIEHNCLQLKDAEINFKNHIKDILKSDLYHLELTGEIKESFRSYVSKDWSYFIRPDYDNDALGVLLIAQHNYQHLLSQTYFRLKKDLLHFFEELSVASNNSANRNN